MFITEIDQIARSFISDYTIGRLDRRRSVEQLNVDVIKQQEEEIDNGSFKSLTNFDALRSHLTDPALAKSKDKIVERYIFDLCVSWLVEEEACRRYLIITALKESSNGANLMHPLGANGYYDYGCFGINEGYHDSRRSKYKSSDYKGCRDYILRMISKILTRKGTEVNYRSWIAGYDDYNSKIKTKQTGYEKRPEVSIQKDLEGLLFEVIAVAGSLKDGFTDVAKAAVANFKQNGAKLEYRDALLKMTSAIMDKLNTDRQRYASMVLANAHQAGDFPQQFIKTVGIKDYQSELLKKFEWRMTWER